MIFILRIGLGKLELNVIESSFLSRLKHHIRWNIEDLIWWAFWLLVNIEIEQLEWFRIDT